MRRNVWSGFALIAGLLAVSHVFAQGGDVDFAISSQYLKWLAQENSAAVTMDVQLTGHTKNVHGLAEDCEMHLAGKPIDLTLGSPKSIVVEPPNLCRFAPPASLGASWPGVFDSHVMERHCTATGFPRIFTEHASGHEDPANPNHVFEIHPAVAISCDGEEISFRDMLTIFPGMRAIKPSSAQSCATTRTLDVRFKSNRYEFRQAGGTGCGNFAIIEVGFVEPAWVKAIKGGHTAIARVSLDGTTRTTLKLYTLAGSRSDEWLAGVLANGQGDQRIFLHGMFTYDYFSMVKVLKPQGSQTWKRPTNWTRVPFPIAFVVFGESDVGPGGEH